MYGFYDNPTHHTIDDLDDLIANGDVGEVTKRLWAAFADPAHDAELELKAALRGPNEMIFDVAPSEWRRAHVEGILARGNDPRTLDVLARTSRFSEVLAFVSHNPATPPAAHMLLVQNEYAKICQGSALALPMTLLTYDLAAPCARVTLLARPDVTEEIVHRGARDPFSDARMYAAAHILATPADLTRLITDEVDEVAEQAAANPFTPAEALRTAMTDPRPKVRGGLGKNPTLAGDLMATLVEYAVHLMDVYPRPIAPGLTGDELDAAFEAHDVADDIFGAAAKRDDLDRDLAVTAYRHCYGYNMRHMKPPFTPVEVELLRAIRDGHVADRYHARFGWATRRTDLRSGGRGGGMGKNVTDAAGRLAAKELAENTAPQDRFGDWPWRLTVRGEAWLAEHDG